MNRLFLFGRYFPRCLSTGVLVALLGFWGTASAETGLITVEQKIANATSAAPTAVGNSATVVEINAAGDAQVLRAGSNNFTCLLDNPASPGNDPMCLDKNGMLWAQAWMSKSKPPADAIGFGYMLQGGSDAHNMDP